MSHTTHKNGGTRSVAVLKINTLTFDGTGPDAGIEVDDDHAGSPVEKLRFNLEQYKTLELYAWAQDQDLDVEVRRVEGYSANGDEILGAFVASAVITAAVDADAVAEAEVVQLHTGAVLAGEYVVLANRAGATAAGRLHLYGIAKA